MRNVKCPADVKFAPRASEIRLRRVTESLRDKLWWVPRPSSSPAARTPHTPLSPPINFLMGQHVPCWGDRWSPAENCIKQNGRSMIAPINGASRRRPLRLARCPLKSFQRLVGGDRGVWGVARSALRGGKPPIFVAKRLLFILYSFFFILYYLKRTTNGRPYIDLKRTTNGRPYIDLFDLKTDDPRGSPLRTE